MIRRVDPVGRAAYGGLCIAGMAALSLPLLLAGGGTAAIVYATDGDGEKGLIVGLLSLACAAFAAMLFLAIFYTAWPFAADWIMEWPGYATGFSVAGVGLALMALLVFVVPVPLYLAVLAPLVATFVAGFGVAGKLAGLKSPAARSRPKAKALRRR